MRPHQYHGTHQNSSVGVRFFAKNIQVLPFIKKILADNALSLRRASHIARFVSHTTQLNLSLQIIDKRRKGLTVP